MSLFLSFYVLAFEFLTVGPLFVALSMLMVFEPVTLVYSTIGVVVDAKSMRLVCQPATLLYIAISVDYSAISLGLVSVPPAFVNGAVSFDVEAAALSRIRPFYPLASVVNTLRQSLGVTEFKILASRNVVRSLVELEGAQIIYFLPNPTYIIPFSNEIATDRRLYLY